MNVCGRSHGSICSSPYTLYACVHMWEKYISVAMTICDTHRLRFPMGSLAFLGCFITKNSEVWKKYGVTYQSTDQWSRGDEKIKPC